MASTTEKAGFPVRPSIGWFLETSPVIEQIDGFLPDIAIGAQNSLGWAFNVVGGTIDGRPRQLVGPVFPIFLLPSPTSTVTASTRSCC